jgi:hypothetical protein
MRSDILSIQRELQTYQRRKETSSELYSQVYAELRAVKQNLEKVMENVSVQKFGAHDSLGAAMTQLNNFINAGCTSQSMLQTVIDALDKANKQCKAFGRFLA